MAYAVEMRHISKRFPGVQANRDVTFAVEDGSIHGLIGENGAGKTTLMKILYGMYAKDEGEILIHGKPVEFHSAKDAIASSIGMVHQHFTLVPSLTVAQNIMLGRPLVKRGGLLDVNGANRTVRELGTKYGLEVNPEAQVKDLPVAVKQRVEILKALYLGADILIMDEPTAVLTPQEIDQLLHTLVMLKQKGKSIILITHKLKELMQVTDWITVLRGGEVMGRVRTVETNQKEIAAMMVGRAISFEVDKPAGLFGPDALRMERIRYTNAFGVQALSDVSLHVREGEILGVAGVQGNGQTELIEVLAGMVRTYEGEITIAGAAIAPQATPLKRRRAGLAHIPEDRQEMGAALGATLLDNFIMGDLDNPAYTSRGVIHYPKAARAADAQYKLFDVRYAGLSSVAAELSGGNLQKAIVAREMYRDPLVLIAAQPSRGVDIGATLFIHEKLLAMRRQGKAILLVSSELSEIMTLSDRIIVMYKGAIVGETTPQESTEADIGLMMAGIRKGEDR